VGIPVSSTATHCYPFSLEPTRRSTCIAASSMSYRCFSFSSGHIILDPNHKVLIHSQVSLEEVVLVVHIQVVAIPVQSVSASDRRNQRWPAEGTGHRLSPIYLQVINILERRLFPTSQLKFLHSSKLACKSRQGAVTDAMVCGRKETRWCLATEANIGTGSRSDSVRDGRKRQLADQTRSLL